MSAGPSDPPRPQGRRVAAFAAAHLLAVGALYGAALWAGAEPHLAEPVPAGPASAWGTLPSAWPATAPLQTRGPGAVGPSRRASLGHGGAERTPARADADATPPMWAARVELAPHWELR